MTYRTRTITLSNGVQLHTPVLVPGISSMAMPAIRYSMNKSRSRRPVACSIIHSDMLASAWDDGILLSAYDIHHHFVADADTLLSPGSGSRYTRQKLLIVDSGWYEHHVYRRSLFFDQDPPRPWDMSLYELTIDSLDPALRSLVVSWDEPEPESYQSQITHTKRFFKHRDHIASTILLKPPANTHFHNFTSLRRDLIPELSHFDVIGVTDDDLGDSLIDQLFQLATLRKMLDNAMVEAPIHVFGGLDPIMTPLLFAAGAEIFDGLGWLRYFYKDGLSLSQHTGRLLEGSADERSIISLTTGQLANLVGIRSLEEDLRSFARSGGEWSALPHQRDRLREIFEFCRRSFEPTDI